MLKIRKERRNVGEKTIAIEVGQIETESEEEMTEADEVEKKIDIVVGVVSVIALVDKILGGSLCVFILITPFCLCMLLSFLLE